MSLFWIALFLSVLINRQISKNTWKEDLQRAQLQEDVRVLGRPQQDCLRGVLRTEF